MNDFFLIAKIISSFDKNGFVKIKSFSDFPDRFFKLKYVYLDFLGEKKKIFIDEIKWIENFFVVKFKNFDNDTDCKILLGKEIFVDSLNSVQLPKDNYFIHDLIGSTVFRNNSYFGKLVDVYVLPANDVYVIIDSNENEVLIPALKNLIESFDSENKIMILKPGDDIYEQDED